MDPWPVDFPLAGNACLDACSLEDLRALREIGQATYRDAFASMNSPDTMDAYLRVKEALAGYLKVNLPPAQSDLNDPKTIEIERIHASREYQGSGRADG